MFKFLKTVKFGRLFKLIVPAVILLIVISVCLVFPAQQQFSYLAKAFLHGHTYFSWNPGTDAVLWRGKYYWALGPLPAVLLMPFVGLFSLLHSFFYQAYLQWILILGVMFFIFKIARALSYSAEDGLVLSFGFILGSVFIGVASVDSSWYFAQVLTTFLLFWGLYEFYTRKRWWVVGLACALILATRISAAPIIIFFSLELWQAGRFDREKLKKYVQLYAPFLVSIILLGLYNFARFHNVLEQGYSYQPLVPTLAKARSYGIFGLVQVPGNLYAAFLSPPLPVFRDSLSHVLAFPYIQNNPWGMSIFITSPYLLYLVTLKKKAFNARAIRLIVAALVSMALVFSYYGLGWRQFGYRYSLDFLPVIFLLFMIKYRDGHKSLSTSMNWLLIGSGVANFYLLLTFLSARG